MVLGECLKTSYLVKDDKTVKPITRFTSLGVP